MIESAVTDFPEPDSPTSASVSPLRMSKETQSAASASRSPRPKATESSRTERRGESEEFICFSASGDASRQALDRVVFLDSVVHASRFLIASAPASPKRLARVEGIAHRLADEDQQRQHDADGEKARQPEPGRLEIGLALRQHLAQRRRARRQSEAQEVERSQLHDGSRQDERQHRHRGHHGVRQEMAKHDHRVGNAEGARRLDVFEVTAAKEFGAHQADQRYPGKQQQDSEQDEESRHEYRGNDEEQVEFRYRGPDLDEALEQQIGPAAKISLHGAGHDTDHRRYDRQEQAEQDRDAETVDHAGNEVAALVVGAKPVVFEVPASGE